MDDPQPEGHMAGHRRTKILSHARRRGRVAARGAAQVFCPAASRKSPADRVASTDDASRVGESSGGISTRDARAWLHRGPHRRNRIRLCGRRARPPSGSCRDARGAQGRRYRDREHAGEPCCHTGNGKNPDSVCRQQRPDRHRLSRQSRPPRRQYHRRSRRARSSPAGCGALGCS
jgi:hypothetical protein